MSDEPTVSFNLKSLGLRPFIRTDLDLEVLGPEGFRSLVPLCYTQTVLGRPGGDPVDIALDHPDIAHRQAVVHFVDGQLFLINHNEATPAVSQGREMAHCRLARNESVSLGPFSLKVLGLGEQLGSLEGYSGAYQGRRWGLGSEPVCIGRKGKRHNQVELDEPTVSRTHATIEHHEGNFSISADAEAALTLVNGNKISVGENLLLEDGDLIQVGQQMLRFHEAPRKRVAKPLECRDATILFSDIWDYSSLSEAHPLEQIIGQVNEFYTSVGQVVEQHGGVLMTFLGDAVMAVFGLSGSARAGAEQAVGAALEMHRQVELLNQRWTARSRPSFRIGVGINSGEVMVGDVGFAGKLEFAAMGDNTNLAARLEKLTREFDCQVIVSEGTQKLLGPGFHCRALGNTSVKGRRQAVDIFEVQA